MKYAYIILILVILSTPIFVFAKESLTTGRLQMTFEDNGNWQLTDNQVNITWHGQWIYNNLMKVTGSDDSCFIIGENRDGMVQIDCQNLTEISVLLSYPKSEI